jgi:hypothetical protein
MWIDRRASLISSLIAGRQTPLINPTRCNPIIPELRKKTIILACHHTACDGIYIATYVFFKMGVKALSQFIKLKKRELFS